MKDTEAVKIIMILLSADNYNSSCARDLCDKFVAVFPQHMGLALEMFDETYPFGS